MILVASTCSLKRFMSAWFDNEREEIDFESIHLEYVDLSGIGKTAQLELEARVQWINNRIERVKMLIYALRMCLEEFGRPFQAAIEDLRKMGHKLTWSQESADVGLMLQQLQRIESKEKRFLIQLEDAQTALDTFIQNQNAGAPQTNIQTRQSFITNMNVLRKEGYPVIQNETTVEEFALMIKAHNEEIERQNKTKK